MVTLVDDFSDDSLATTVAARAMMKVVKITIEVVTYSPATLT